MDQAVFYGILIPFLGTSLGAACVFFMKHDMRTVVPDSYRVCCGGDGGGIHLEFTDSGGGSVGRDGKVCVYSSSSWILGWHSVSASVRSHHPTFAQVQCQRRGTKEQIAENHHDGAGRHAA